MKAILFIFALLANALTIAEAQSKPLAVPGQKIYIDVAWQKDITVSYQSRSFNDELSPKVQFINQWSGFQCQYRQTRLAGSTVDSTTKELLRDWEIQIDFSPGADLSGCIYSIQFPEQEDAFIELDMIF